MTGYQLVRSSGKIIFVNSKVGEIVVLHSGIFSNSKTDISYEQTSGNQRFERLNNNNPSPAFLFSRVIPLQRNQQIGMGGRQTDRQTDAIVPDTFIMSGLS